MKKLLLGICYLLVSQTVISQSLQGLLLDKANGQPIASATIETKGSYFTQTGEDGRFNLPIAKGKSTRVQISCVGYFPIDTLITQQEGLLQLFLQASSLLMKPVEVKALRAGEKAPFTKTNISGKEIEQLNLGQDLPFLFNQTPSVVINSDAGNGIGYTGIRIRGSDATRINMTINGIPYNDAESQGLFFVNLPDFASSVNNIQIQRGVGTSSNGAGAFGGSINFNTNETHEKAYAEVNNSFGSFNSLKNTVKAGSGLLNKHFTLDARLSNISSDGYIERAFSRLGSFYFSAAYLTEKSSLRLNVTSGKEKTYQAWYGVSQADLATNRTVNYAGTERPGSPYDNETDNYQQDHYQLFYNHQINTNWSYNTALFLTKGRGYYEQYKADQDYSKYGLPNFVSGTTTLTSTDVIRQLWLDNSFYGQVFSIQQKNETSQFTLGGGWNNYLGQHFGELKWLKDGNSNLQTGKWDSRWYDHHPKKSDINLYSKYQLKLGSKGQLFADLQYRSVQYNIDGFRDNPTVLINKHFGFLNPKIGYTYTGDHLQWYASYAIGQKEPNREDFEAGTVALPKPEKMGDLELGVEQKKATYQWSLTGYYMRYKDQLVLTGKINDVGAYTRTNIDQSYRLGLEMQGGWRPCNWASMNGNLTLSSNKAIGFVEYYDDYDQGGQIYVEHGNTTLALSPAVTQFAALNLTPFKNAGIVLSQKYVSRQFLDNTSNVARSLNPYNVFDLKFNYVLKGKLVEEANFLVQLNNVFNKKYEPNGYTYSYKYGGVVVTENFYFPMAERNFMVGVNLRF